MNTLEEDYIDNVTIGDDTKYLVKGIGTYKIILKCEITLELKKVLYEPSIKRNLVSTSALEDEGYKVAFIEGKVLAWPKNSNI